MYDGFVLAPARKMHGPVDKGKDRMVLAKADIPAWMIAGPTLADDDIARRHLLAAPNLYTEAFAV